MSSSAPTDRLPESIRRLGRIHHVAVIVAELDPAIAFWRDALGLELEVIEEMADDRVRIAFLPIGESKVELARSVAAEIGFADARFVQSDLYALPAVLEGQFDLVFTSGGVLGWLPDIKRWAEVVAHFVRPGGRFYITEIHPIAQVFENEGVTPGELPLFFSILATKAAE